VPNQELRLRLERPAVINQMKAMPPAGLAPTNRIGIQPCWKGEQSCAVGFANETTRYVHRLNHRAELPGNRLESQSRGPVSLLGPRISTKCGRHFESSSIWLSSEFHLDQWVTKLLEFLLWHELRHHLTSWSGSATPSSATTEAPGGPPKAISGTLNSP